MNAPSLAGFIEMTEANFRLFDLGSHLRKLPSTTLRSLDEGSKYPHPHLGFGWLVIFLWNEQEKAQNSLWFLKLPLDEQGILTAAVHSDLVNRLYRALQTADPKERQRLLTDHPYQFKPDHEKMAALHASATHILGLEPSDYYASASAFYSGSSETASWQTLGVQGIADLVIRSNDAELSRMAKRIAEIEEPPAIALLQQFEHRVLPTKAVETLTKILESDQASPALKEALYRACAQSPAAKLVEPSLYEHLASSNATIETLLMVVTRYTHLLSDEQFAVNVLTQLAQRSDADGFARVMTNLAMQDQMDRIVMRMLGSQFLNEPLANALTQLIQRTAQRRHDH